MLTRKQILRAAKFQASIERGGGELRDTQRVLVGDLQSGICAECGEYAHKCACGEPSDQLDPSSPRLPVTPRSACFDRCVERELNKLWRDLQDDGSQVPGVVACIAAFARAGAITQDVAELWRYRMTTCPGHAGRTQQ